jgi:hypothetical protein
MGVTCSTHGRDEECKQNLVGNAEGRRPLGDTSLMEDNIKIILKIGWEFVDWIQLAQDGIQLQSLENK